MIAVVFCFRHVRLAKKMLHNRIPRPIVSQTHLQLQRFLQLGTLLDVAGMMLGITGVGVSISVSVAKVVPQPPGIAITHPKRIIRAFDVFVLLANFGVICGHFTGMITSLWLLSRTGRLYPEPAVARQLLPAAAKEASVQSAGE